MTTASARASLALVPREAGFRPSVAPFGGQGELRRGARLAGTGEMVALEPWPRQKGLDAPSSAAIALWAGTFVVFGRGQGIVTPLARDRIGPAQWLALDDDAAAHPRAEYHAEHDVRPGRRSIGQLGYRKAVRIVLNPHRALQRGSDVAVEGTSVQAGAVGVLDQAGRRRDGARYADPDRSSRARLPFDRRHQPHDRRNGAFIVAGGSGDAPASDFPVAFAQGYAFDLGTADIYPDADSHKMRLSIREN